MAAPVFQTANSLATTGTATSITVTAPSGVQSDDIVLAHVYLEVSNAVTAPSGFTEVTNSPVNTTATHFVYHRTFWKRSTGSEPASYSFTFSSHNADRAICVQRYSGCITSGNPVEVTAEAFRNSAATTTPAVSLTTSGADRLIVWSGAIWAVGTWTNPTNYTLRSTGTTNLGVATRTQAVAGSTGSITGSSTASEYSTAFILALLPAPSGTDAPATTATAAVAAQNASVSTSASANAGTAGFGVAAQDPALAPGTLLNIGPNSGQNHFSVQVSRRGDPDILTETQEDIRAGYNEDPWFTANSDNSAVQLYAPVDGPTTSGATSARCELREVFDDGSNMGFDALTGTHIFHGRSKIIHDPPVLPDIVLAQLHNGSSDRVAIRTQLVTGTRRLRIRINGTSATLDAGGLDVQNPYVVGTEIEWKIELSSGTVRVYVDDMVTAKVTSTALVSTGSDSWYFKAGCYIQTTTSSDVGSEYGEVELRDLQTAHGTPATNAPAATGSLDVSAQTPAAEVSSSVPSADLSVSAQGAGGQALVNAATGTFGVAAQDATVTAVAFINAPASAATLGVDAGSAAGLVSAPDSVPPAVGITAQDASATSSGSGNAAGAALGVAGLDASVTASGSAAADVASLGVSAQAASVTSSAFALADSASLGVAAQDAMVGGSGSAFAETATFGVDALAGTSQTTGNAVVPAEEATTSFAAAQPSGAALTNPEVATGLVAAQDGSAGISAASVTADLGFAAQDASVQVTTGAQTANFVIDALDITSVFGNLAFAVTATIGVDAAAPGVTIHSQASVAMLLMLAQLPEAHVPELVGAINMLIRVTASIIAADSRRSSVVGSSHTPGIITMGTERKTATITGMGRVDG